MNVPCVIACEVPKEGAPPAVTPEKPHINFKIQPYMLQNIPSMNCKYDWDYMELGKNWKCNCNEGRE